MREGEVLERRCRGIMEERKTISSVIGPWV